MENTFQRVLLSLGAILFLGVASMTYAADDPSIKGDLRTNIKASMNTFVSGQTINGRMYLFDGVQGKLLKMKLVELHDGIVKKGDFYVSCADFVDQNGVVIDVDFLVRPKEGQLITTQAVVHSVDGKKRKYHLEEL